jgi:hypothetical protein
VRKSPDFSLTQYNHVINGLKITKREKEREAVENAMLKAKNARRKRLVELRIAKVSGHGSGGSHIHSKLVNMRRHLSNASEIAKLVGGSMVKKHHAIMVGSCGEDNIDRNNNSEGEDGEMSKSEDEQ